MGTAIKFDVNNQPISTVSFEALAQLYDLSNPIDDWFRQRYFSDVKRLNGKDLVPVGEIDTYIPIAPAVKPTVQGRVIEAKVQANVDYVPAAYFKPAWAVTPSDDVNDALVKYLTELGVIANTPVTQPMDMRDEWQVASAQAYGILRKSLSGRINLMCRDALLYGKVKVDGKDFDYLEVDFGRHPELNFTPLVKWGEQGATPYQDQKKMVSLLIKHGKKRPVDAIMSSRVFDSFVDDDEFNKKFKASENTNATRVFAGTFGGQVEATLQGRVDGINYWTYDADYTVIDNDGVKSTERMIPEDGFWFISEPNNRLYFCMIVHRRNPNKLAMEYFPYHVFSDDPSVDKFILDSSPMPVPINKNGACGGTGFINL